MTAVARDAATFDNHKQGESGVKSKNDMQQAIKHAVRALAALGTLASATAVAQQPLVYCAEQEKCYGVARAGKNDCSTATSACAGTARQDFQKDAWMLVPKGTCLKLAGGSLQPAKATTDKK
jgi:uncharacterized membrane protein